jgi:hypothetical protein
MKNPIRRSILFFTPSLPNFHLSTVNYQLSTINSQRVSLVSACVTLSNAARPLFIGVLSACQPYLPKSHVCILSRQTSNIKAYEHQHYTREDGAE